MLFVRKKSHPASMFPATLCASPVCLCPRRIGWQSKPRRDTRCPCTSCPERWTPVSIRIHVLGSCDAFRRTGRPDTEWTHCVCLPGPIVGEFPAQNDVNLAPAPSLPQVMIMFFIVASAFINQTAFSTRDIFTLFRFLLHHICSASPRGNERNKSHNSCNMTSINCTQHICVCSTVHCFSQKERGKISLSLSLDRILFFKKINK